MPIPFLLAMFLSADSAQALPPRLLPGAGPLVSAADYPPEASSHGEFGVVSVLLQVSAAGTVSGCVVTETTAFRDLDTITCRLLQERARFAPAADATGAAVAGEYRMAIPWGVAQKIPTTSIELELQVTEVPPNYMSPSRSQVLFDRTGHAVSCTVTASSGDGDVDTAACGYIIKTVTTNPPFAAGAGITPMAVRYVSTTLVASKGG